MSIEPITVLVAGEDTAFGQVLARVLGRLGHIAVHAPDAASALKLADDKAVRLALLDAGHRKGSSLALAANLRERFPNLPVIWLTDDPLDESKLPASCQGGFLQVRKPINLGSLGEAIETALVAPAELTSPVRSTLPAASARSQSKWIAKIREFPMRASLQRLLKIAGGVFLAIVVLTVVAIFMGAIPLDWRGAPANGAQPQPPKPEPVKVKLVDDQPHTLSVPEDVRKALGITTAKGEMIVEAKKPAKGKALVMPGSTALDPTHLYRIRARFAPSPSSAECIELGKVRDNSKVPTEYREIRSGDRVYKEDPQDPKKRGTLLCVFFSVDVGNMKNNLIDAIFQLELDEEILKKAKASDAVPEAFILNAEKSVRSDINTINKTVATLEAWGISKEDIQAVRDEAEEVKKRKGKHDKEKDARWGRVEIRAPDDGIILERNLALKEVVVDNTTNCFQIAKLDKLFVTAYCPEDDLPSLEALPTEKRQWTIETVGSPPIKGVIDDISYLIDPNQHTAVIKGHIDNPINPKTGLPLLRGTQFIRATVELDAPEDVVEIPVDALVDDGLQCIVFVQTDPQGRPDRFTMRRVDVTARFEKSIFVRSKLFAKDERTQEEKDLGMLPKEPLKLGDRVLTTGVGELKAELLEQESEQGKDKKKDEK
ncbi:MAG TPA: efflux RND transporter periplasmic adaptor subunit [Gemmataceae bacterium]|nr:efflux RND transporter periplasmic adaptor subunit [Gemmataceae bacterium]